MPKITTHLNLALRLAEKLNIENVTDFLLGNAYPDCWYKDDKEALERHYKISRESDCDLKAFLRQNNLDSFNLGYYFHLWTDNRFKILDTGDISHYDRVICDMPCVYPVFEKLNSVGFTGRMKEAMDNISAVAADPVPLYIVDEEKQRRYEEILDNIAGQFAAVYVFFTR